MKKKYLLLAVSLICSIAYGREMYKAPRKNDDLPEMVAVPAGAFSMGNGSRNADADEQPAHLVTVNGFKMGKYEVTVKEFAAFIKATGYQTDAEKVGDSWIFTGAFTKKKGVNWRDDEVGHELNENEWDKPVIHVSWNDVVAYCSWLSSKTGKHYRLPTEAEWEYAGGNGNKHTLYSWGNSSPTNNKPVGNVADESVHPKYGALKEKFKGYNDGYFFSAPVGTFPPNNFGLYDMTGNVWEWCSDWFDINYYAKSPSNNPQGPATGQFRVIRGGSWFGGPDFSGVTYRAGMPPDYRALNIGFRVVCDM